MTALPTVLLSPVEADQVRAATENCPTCEGSGLTCGLAEQRHLDECGDNHSCPDCSGKRPGVVTLVVEGHHPSIEYFRYAQAVPYGGRIPPSRWAPFDGQRVTLTVECPTCGGSGVAGATARADGYGGLLHKTVKCRDCFHGTVPLATATVRVEPGDGTHWNITLEQIEEGL